MLSRAFKRQERARLYTRSNRIGIDKIREAISDSFGTRLVREEVLELMTPSVVESEIRQITINSEDQKVLEKPLQGAKAASHLFSRVRSGPASQQTGIDSSSQRRLTAQAEYWYADVVSLHEIKSCVH